MRRSTTRRCRQVWRGTVHIGSSTPKAVVSLLPLIVGTRHVQLSWSTFISICSLGLEDKCDSHGVVQFNRLQGSQLMTLDH